MAGDVFSLTDNPFAELGLTPRSSREQIEDRAGASHPAAQILLDPFGRLTEELAWLPGASGQAAQETVQSLARRDAAGVSQRLLLLRGLAKANLAADAAARFADPDMVDHMVRAWDSVETADVAGAVNADRMISGFPQVNPAQVGWALQTVRERQGASVVQVLAQVPDGRERLVRLIERPAPSGHDADLKLIDALVTAFSELIAPVLDKKEDSILAEVAAMTRGGRDGTDRLESLIDDWKRAHWPALLLAARRGREDARALSLVGDIRILYLDPSVGPQRLAPAGRIAAVLAQAFPQAPAIQRMAASDLARLGGTALPTPAPTPPAQPASAPVAPKRQQPQRQAAKPKPKPSARQAVTRTLNQAEAAREALVAQVRARVEAQGQVAHGQPRKKKAGCGWIIALIVGGFMLVRCINNLDTEAPRAPTIEAPAYIPPATVPETPVDPAAPAPETRGPGGRDLDNEIGAGAPADEFAPPEVADDGSTGGGSDR